MMMIVVTDKQRSRATINDDEDAGFHNRIEAVVALGGQEGEWLIFSPLPRVAAKLFRKSPTCFGPPLS